MSFRWDLRGMKKGTREEIKTLNIEDGQLSLHHQQIRLNAFFPPSQILKQILRTERKTPNDQVRRLYNHSCLLLIQTLCKFSEKVRNRFIDENLGKKFQDTMDVPLKYLFLHVDLIIDLILCGLLLACPFLGLLCPVNYRQDR